jgi:hypothetical protein
MIDKGEIFVPRHPTLEELHRFESAGEFLKQLATEIQDWLRENTSRDPSGSKTWILVATLPDGTRIIMDRLVARGHTLLRLEGEKEDGTPCLLLAHHHGVQFVAYLVPRKKAPAAEPAPKREIGFHTGIGKEIRIEQ